ncbi:NAD-dependent epimerase/dehydratase family protein [Paenibacillus andongensis]|uniref:NAD-dependent epimerase/dehydratase family protein n=1 Tax=Paenibacillus andongensis TaxID=2975482 RepID=UPI0021BB9B57|nr:NAD-dependent epimerase/dehydratase family protein [Paenibacillus andongensis]
MNTSTKEAKTIAILGATGHIAKNLIYYLSNEENYNLVLFARSVSKIEHFLNDNFLLKSNCTICDMEQFALFSYDVIINCIGIVDSTKSKQEQQLVFTVTEEYDNLILNYLQSHSKALYINLSSGAAYSTSFDKAANQNTKSEIDINNLLPTHNYGITKLYMEAKHRAFDNYNIVDLRVFSFFSRFIDLNSNFLLTDIIQCLREDKILRTNDINIVRDYIHPIDFIELIKLCISKQEINDVFDMYSLSPVLKFDILNYFIDEYGLKIEIDKSYSLTSPSGIKNNYYSINKKSNTVLSYHPIYTSLDCIKEEIRFMYTGSQK